MHVLSSEFYKSTDSLAEVQKLQSFKNNNLVIHSPDDTLCLSVLSKIPSLKKLKLINVLNSDLKSMPMPPEHLSFLSSLKQLRSLSLGPWCTNSHLLLLCSSPFHLTSLRIESA